MLTKRQRRRTDACDVVVVGAGLVGAAVAARLSAEGFDVAILEARKVGGGATGRSLGLTSLGLAGNYRWAVSVYGRQRAREIWALTAGGRARLVATAQRLGVAVVRSGSYTLADDDEEVEALWESMKLLREDGFDASFSLSDPLGRGFEAMLRNPEDVTVDAAALTRALLQAESVSVHEGTEVQAVEPMQDGVRVWAHGRTVVCSAVVLAVNGYAALVEPYLSEHVAPVPYAVFATEPLEQALSDRPCVVGSGKTLLRSLHDGRTLFAARQRWESLGGGHSPPAPLVDLVSRRFPELDLRRTDHWTEVSGATPDGLPLVGRLPSSQQVYFGVGLGGRGLSWAFVVAERLVDAMLHGVDPGLLSSDRLVPGTTST